MATKIRLRRGTASEWLFADPILGLGEVGLEVDTKNFKVGDGLTAWSSLEYYIGYSSTEIDILLTNKANSSDVYTSLEVDALLSDKANSSDVYTNTEVDSLLSQKSNSVDVYTKQETDALVNAKVFGDNYQYFEDLVTFTTNSGSNQTAASFTTSELSAGTYRVSLQWNFTINSTTNSAFFEMYVDGVIQNQPIQVELKDSTDDITYSLFQNIILNAGSHVIQLRTRTEGGSTVTIPVVKCDLWRIQ